MTISDAHMAKTELEENILAEIEKFQVATGLHVKSVYPSVMDSFADGPKIVRVEAEVTL